MKIYSLINLGNTCYLNSVLQCFINVPYFKNQLTDNELSKYLKELENDLTDNDEYINHKYNPSSIVNYFNKKFKRFQQHDAHEFLLEFLEQLELKDYYGTIKMNVICSCCNTISSTFEKFSTINLQCENNVVDSFIKYLEKENIHDYHCEKCKRNTLALKKIYLQTLPSFLIIVLKRYNTERYNTERYNTERYNTERYNTESKNNKLINYPIENMKIRETESGNIFNYNLYAVIYHHGNSENGHYNCSVKINTKWYFIDDQNVQLMNKIENNNSNSYILFYNKI